MSKKPNTSMGAITATRKEVAQAVANEVEGAAMQRQERAESKSTKWKEGRRVITAWIPDDQYKKLIVLHVDQHRLLRVLLEEAIDDLLIKYEQLPSRRTS